MKCPLCDDKQVYFNDDYNLIECECLTAPRSEYHPDTIAEPRPTFWEGFIAGIVAAIIGKSIGGNKDGSSDQG